MKLITPQTSENGKIVRRVYLEKGYEIAKEFYLCITVDRDWKYYYFLKERGLTLKKLQKSPDEIHTMQIAPGSDLLTHHARTIVYNLGLKVKKRSSSEEYSCYL